MYWCMMRERESETHFELAFFSIKWNRKSSFSDSKHTEQLTDSRCHAQETLYKVLSETCMELNIIQHLQDVFFFFLFMFPLLPF